MKSGMPGHNHISRETMRRLVARFDELDLNERLKREAEVSERETEKRISIFGKRISFCQLLERQLMLAGLYGRAIKNAGDVEVK